MEHEPFKVAIRFRPLNDQEQQQGQEAAWQLTSHSVTLLPQAVQRLAEEKRPMASQFEYDNCFSWGDDNARVYETVAKQIVLSALDGYNASVFAYGQTGSGKTYTMLGKCEGRFEPVKSSAGTPKGSLSGTPKSNRHPTIKPSSSRTKLHVEPLRSRSSCASPRSKSVKCVKSPSVSKIKPYRALSKGLITLALEDIFEKVAGETDRHYFFTCSYIEIYNEHVYDLLIDPTEHKASHLPVVEGSDKEFTVLGLTEQVVTSLTDVTSLVKLGEENRHYASTILNHNSSRSHTIFRLNVRSLEVLMKHPDDSFENITMESVLNFVDLAGSERLTLTSTQAEERSPQQKSFSFNSTSETDKLAAEGKTINTSLFYLCQVINKLSEQRLGMLRNDAYINFRNSNLTKILRSSLGGNSRTCILFTASPTLSSFEQTLSTLKFANRARTVTNHVFANVRRETSTQLLLTYETDIVTLKQELEKSHNKGVAMAKETLVIKAQYESKLQKLKSKLQDQPKVYQRPIIGGEVLLPGVGDVFGRVGSWEGEARLETLKCDSEGMFALQRLKQVKGERDELRLVVKDLSNSVSCLRASKNSVKSMQIVVEIDQKAYNIDSLRKRSDACVLENISLAGKLDSVIDEIGLYQGSTDLKQLTEDEIAVLERTLTNTLQQITRERTERTSQKKMELLQGLLKDVVPAAQLQAAWMVVEGASLG
jgi:centromeric protein E